MPAALLVNGCSLPQAGQPVRPWAETSTDHMKQRTADDCAQDVQCACPCRSGRQGLAAHLSLAGRPPLWFTAWGELTASIGSLALGEGLPQSSTQKQWTTQEQCFLSSSLPSHNQHAPPRPAGQHPTLFPQHSAHILVG